MLNDDEEFDYETAEKLLSGSGLGVNFGCRIFNVVNIRGLGLKFYSGYTVVLGASSTYNGVYSHNPILGISISYDIIAAEYTFYIPTNNSINNMLHHISLGVRIFW